MLTTMMTADLTIDLLREKFGNEVGENVPLARYTTARIGGPADFLITAHSADELATIVPNLWELGTDCFILGGGSNVLVGDKGVRGVTILNRAKAVRFADGSHRSVVAESGVVFSNLANRCALRGWAGLEWAGTIPGTIGGAVYGNAGAFGGDMAGSLISAELVTPSGRELWSVEKLGYGYRTSALKRRTMPAVVLSAELRLGMSTRGEAKARMAEFGARRKATQPPGASMGSMFKNPQGDAAGRLIEAAGLKGRRIGNAEISPIHANFFICHGATRASDVRELIELAQRTVRNETGVDLELEIEMVGQF